MSSVVFVDVMLKHFVSRQLKKFDEVVLSGQEVHVEPKNKIQKRNFEFSPDAGVPEADVPTSKDTPATSMFSKKKVKTKGRPRKSRGQRRFNASVAKRTSVRTSTPADVTGETLQMEQSAEHSEPPHLEYQGPLEDLAPIDWWLQDKKLTIGDLNIIQDNGWLTDSIMDAVMSLVPANEATPVAVLHSHDCSIRTTEGIDFLCDNNHWIMVEAVGQEIKIYNSLTSAFSENLKRQIFGRFANKVVDNQLQVTIEPCQQQVNGYDCGVFASAFLAERANGKVPGDKVFEVSVMRDHLKACLISGELAPFPGTSKRGRKTKGVHYTIHFDESNVE